MTTNTPPSGADTPGPQDAKFNEWYDTKFKAGKERGPLDKYVARQAWFAALTAAQQQGLRIVEPIRNCATPESREAAMVVLETDAEGNPTIWCDPEIADLVRALNVGGVRTKASCSGHGEKPFGIVSLQDGRELLVLPDWETTRRAERILDAGLSAQQQGQAVAECHCATCTCAPGMTPAVRFDTSPAAQEGAVRDHLIALGWTPPGAQQPAARPPKPTECMNGCPDRQVCDHCQWPPGPDPQPAAGEEIMVNVAHDVFTLPLQPSGLSSGPRFVVHVPEQPAASAEPVMRIYAEGTMRSVTEWLDGARDLTDGDHTLYAAPVSAQKEDDARDAERYRWLRTRWGRIADEYDGDSDRLVAIREADSHFEGWDVDPASLDRAIDAALAKSTGQKGGDA